MSMANESEEVPRDAGAPDRTPSDSGWSLWSGGSCSITRCLDQPVTAIERSRGLRRPPYLQPYCAAHAGARGVERVGDELVWTAAFLQPRGRISSRRDTATADS
jgi:hypothetical protein